MIPTTLDRAWVERQKKNLTVTQIEFALSLMSYPAGMENITDVQLHAILFSAVKNLQNRLRYNATSRNKNEALRAVRRAWEKCRKYDTERWGIPLPEWDEKFGDKTPTEIVDYFVEQMLTFAFEVEGVSDE